MSSYYVNQFAEYNQQDATFHNLFIYFCKTFYMFQTGFPSIIRSSKLQIQRQVFVRPLLVLPAASLDGMEQVAVLVWQIPDAVCVVLSSWWWMEKPSGTCRASYRNKQIVERCILLVVSANILAMWGPMNVKKNALLDYKYFILELSCWYWPRNEDDDVKPVYSGMISVWIPLTLILWLQTRWENLAVKGGGGV